MCMVSVACGAAIYAYIGRTPVGGQPEVSQVISGSYSDHHKLTHMDSRGSSNLGSPTRPPDSTPRYRVSPSVLPDPYATARPSLPYNPSSPIALLESAITVRPPSPPPPYTQSIRPDITARPSGPPLALSDRSYIPRPLPPRPADALALQPTVLSRGVVCILMLKCFLRVWPTLLVIRVISRTHSMIDLWKAMPLR
jgi:hypothetical protein